MENRDSIILSLREANVGAISNNSSEEESFQNRTLRPILKAQNDLFIAVFMNYAIKQKNTFFSLSPVRKE